MSDLQCSTKTSSSDSASVSSEPKDPASADASLPSVQDQEKTDLSAGNPDGAGCSRQAQPSELLVQKNLAMFAVGKRHYIVGEIQKAVEVLQQACENLSALFGEKARQVAEPYFYYGKALLELVRMESDVLGNALQGVEPEDKGEEKEAGEDSMIEKDEITGGASSSAQDTEEGEDAEDVEEGDGEEGEKEEVQNIQVAWEFLELARIIFAESSDRDSRLRVADVHATLGELGMENSAFEQAIDDLEKCLAVRQELLDSDHRHIAEIHFQLGLAYSFINNYKPAIEHTESAAKVLKAKLENLAKSDDKEAAEKEVGSLQDVLSDVEMKIVDLRDEMKSAALVEKMTKAAEGSSSGFGSAGGSNSAFGAAGGSGNGFGAATGSGSSDGAGGSSDAPVQMIGVRKKGKKEGEEQSKAEPAANDISSIVRKKRKPEESENSEELTQKKAKAETIGSSGVLTDNTAAVNEGLATETQEPKKAVEQPTPVEEGTA